MPKTFKSAILKPHSNIFSVSVITVTFNTIQLQTAFSIYGLELLLS